MALINFYQGGILADRYLETILADFKITSLLILQAPALAGLAVAVWGNIDRANEALYFVMVLSCLFMGCMSACREIVKEHALFLRERMVNLEIGAYLYSKLRVLALLNVIQATSYAIIVYKYLDTRVPVGWLILSLLATTLCGTCMGLFVSALFKRSDYAVISVIFVLLPQILFSEFAISKDAFAGASRAVYLLMPSRWGYDGLIEFAQTDPDLPLALGRSLMLLVLGALFILASAPILKLKKY